MNKKYISGLALFSTGFSGVLAGSLFLNSPISARATDYNEKVPAVVARAEAGFSKTDIADKLSNDFINVSKSVTPSIVTINSTKMVKQVAMGNYDEQQLRRFFGYQGDDENDQQMPEQQQKQQSLGSGVIIDKNGLILTNNHVIDGADEISVSLQDKRKYKAKVIGTDVKTDLAVLKLVNASNLPVARLGDSNKLAVGEWVLAIGNPLGLSSTVTSGIVSAKGRSNVGIADFEDFIQTDAAINPGNSGGALVNLQGEVIGINTAIASKTGGYMGIGFAIPSSMANKVVNDLTTKGKVTRGYLGVQIQDISDSMVKSMKLPENNKGIIVGKVEPGSPADKAGLKIYDIISELNGNVVEDVSSFRNEIASEAPGQNIKLGVLRNGSKINIQLNLAELDKTKTAKLQNNQKQEHNLSLGFQVQPLTPELLSQLQLADGTSGVIISSVKNNSNAGEAGLQRGDVIQEFNRSKIASADDFHQVAKSVHAGDSVLLKVLRGNNTYLLAFSIQ